MASLATEPRPGPAGVEAENFRIIMTLRVHKFISSRRVHSGLIPQSDSFFLSNSNFNTKNISNSYLLTPTALVSRSQFATLSCSSKHILSGSYLSRVGFAKLFASKAPIRCFSIQSEPVSSKSNSGESTSQLCEKIGFIGAGKIAQVRDKARLSS